MIADAAAKWAGVETGVAESESGASVVSDIRARLMEFMAGESVTPQGPLPGSIPALSTAWVDREIDATKEFSRESGIAK